jgi:hypothetical protein
MRSLWVAGHRTTVKDDLKLASIGQYHLFFVFRTRLLNHSPQECSAARRLRAAPDLPLPTLPFPYHQFPPTPDHSYISITLGSIHDRNEELGRRMIVRLGSPLSEWSRQILGLMLTPFASPCWLSGSDSTEKEEVSPTQERCYRL